MIPALCSYASLPAKYRTLHTSWEQNKDAPILSRTACELFHDAYIDQERRDDKLFSPLLWPSGHEGTPRTFFQVCGADPLRDDGLIFEKVLREEVGVETKVQVYPGLPHGFWSVFPKMEASRKFVEESVEGVEWLMERKA